MAAFDEDQVDLQVVVRWLTVELGYTIDLVVGHSRASVGAFQWLCKSEEAKTIRGYVNASGRYRMEVRQSAYRLPIASADLALRKCTVCVIAIRPLGLRMTSTLYYADRLMTYGPSFEAQGFYEWHVTVARQAKVGRIYPEDLDKFAAIDTSIVWDCAPAGLHVLTVHGMEDRQVPV